MNAEFYLEEADDESVEYYAIRPNKTRIKQEIASIFIMVEEISVLSASQIAEFNLPENLEQALLEVGKMAHNAARKRLLKYITAQFRHLDIAEIQETLARFKNQSAHAVREHHKAERWRDQLLADTGTEKLTQLISEYANADAQYLRQLQRNAQKEALSEKPPKSSRLLYKYLKELITQE